MKFTVILKKIRLPFFLLMLVLVSVYSCKEPVEVDQEPAETLSEAAAFELLEQEVAKIESAEKVEKVSHINGKTALDYYREWEQGNENADRTVTCESTPPCPSVPVNQVYNFGACDISYSMRLYNCGQGSYGIFDFEITGVTGNCFFYDMLVTDNYNSGDLDDYQIYSNYFASIILNYWEDLLFTVGGPGLGGNSQVFSYIPNICSASCESNGAEEECGQDCCIRISFYNYASATKTTDVFSAGECGGTTYTCTNGQSNECRNFSCRYLNY